jgi:mono/diheme cytochrome c family protein
LCDNKAKSETGHFLRVSEINSNPAGESGILGTTLIEPEAPMSRNTKIATVLLAASASLGAWYGGWATVTVENLPDQLVAGTPYNLTFSVRQHGDNLLGGLSPYIELASKGEHQKVRAVATNKTGYYTATLNVPQAGEWSANIETSFGKSNLKLMPISAVAPGARSVSYTAPERGQRLFVAKGCVVCHQQAKVAEYNRYEVGPNLTDKRFPAEYLREYLANPSIKPPTIKGVRMPQLNLNAAEIAALTAFINSDAPVRTAQKTK